VYVTSAGGVSVNLTTGNGSGFDAEGDTLTHVENLTGSYADDVLTGDGGANKLLGGDGDDQLFGNGGADLLDGGKGVDTARYDFSSAGVQVNLATGTGTGGDAEGDTLVSIRNVVGSPFADTLTGNSHDNTINGGAGDDTLTGGAGADLFVFNTTPDTLLNDDAITDFQVGLDKIELDHNVFPGLPVGPLAPDAFVTGSAAADTSDRIVYNPATGSVFFDADGSDPGLPIQFANAWLGPALSATDFVVI